jgi:hypothetical protein
MLRHLTGSFGFGQSTPYKAFDCATQQHSSRPAKASAAAQDFMAKLQAFGDKGDAAWASRRLGNRGLHQSYTNHRWLFDSVK